MGVPVRVVVYAEKEEKAERACAAAFARFAELDAILSDYRPTSELMRLCARAGGPPVPVSPDLFTVLERALLVSERSGGAFDVTVGPYVALWRQARRSGMLPRLGELREAGTRVGWRGIRLDPAQRTARLLVPGMRLDLGGIAKGYAGDQAQTVLKRHGIRAALVEAGGDIVVSAAPPGEKGWRIAVEPARMLLLANRAVSTSGDTEQFVEIGGRRYAHIVDPRTGLGLTDRLAVTVTARDGLTSDPLSTAVRVLGARRGAALARRFPDTTAFIRPST